MAARFGGYSPAHDLTFKVRFIVGSLCAVVTVLTLMLVFVLRQAPHSEEDIVSIEPKSAYASTISRVQVLVARQRIESGVEIDPTLVSMQDVPIESIPTGAMLERERNAVVGKFAKQMIPAGSYFNAELLTADRVPLLNQIPPGMRAVTITADSRAGVEWFIQAGSRVDVLLSYTDEKGEKLVATIVPFAKVFSVGGDPNKRTGAPVGGAETKNVTLLVSERDGKKIELGRTMGSLSLLLASDSENPSASGGPKPLTKKEVLGIQDPVQKEEQYVGRIKMRDPRTNDLKEFALNEAGIWVPIQ